MSPSSPAPAAKAAPARAPARAPEPPAAPPRESLNLVILGIGATIIALITTSISLYLYHASGDIYLDRSRPGFLPDESAEEEEFEVKSSGYTYPDSGPVDQAALDEYLNHIKDPQKDLNDLPDPYPSYPLSDQSLMLAIPENGE